MIIIGGVNLGELPNNLFFFSNGSAAADWMDAKHGYLGDAAVNGITAKEHTNAGIPYAGTISTNDTTLGDWQDIVDANPGQALAALGQTALVAGLTADLVGAFQQINALPVTTGYGGRNAASLDGLNTQNGISEVFVINITSGFDISAPINITGDAGDVFILRWDEDENPANGYQGRVRFRQGGAIVPHGGLTPANFIHVAGQIDSAGGGSAPAVPYPQGPRYDNGSGSLIDGGSDWTSGGFFTGYWLTTGEPTTLDPATGLYSGVTSSLANCTFVGGWYTLTTQFILTAQSGGVHVSPNPATYSLPRLSITKLVSPDGGLTWIAAKTAPGPSIPSTVAPRFRFTVKNTGNVTLTSLSVSDSAYGLIGSVSSLPAGESYTWEKQYPWLSGEHENVVTATASFDTYKVSAADLAHYLGVSYEAPAVEIAKYVSPDGGLTWVSAPSAPGPSILSTVVPAFKIVVTNAGNTELSNVTVTDSVYGPIAVIPGMVPGESRPSVFNGTWAEGQHTNIATVTAAFDGGSVRASDTANYFGVNAIAAIGLKKYVSPDGGTTWVEAPAAPGPTISSDILPKFKFTVTNTGNTALSDMRLTDSVYGTIAVVPAMAPGEADTFVITAPWADGLHENVATAAAKAYNQTTVSAVANAFYTGRPAPKPAIRIIKYVSVDGGVTWLDANTAPGPLLDAGVNVKFQYVVTNTGNVPLTGIVVTDDVIGAIGTLPSLAAGASETWTVTPF